MATRILDRSRFNSGIAHTIIATVGPATAPFPMPDVEIQRNTCVVAFPGAGGTLKVEYWFGDPALIGQIHEDEWVPWPEGTAGVVNARTMSILTVPVSAVRVTATVSAGRVMLRS